MEQDDVDKETKATDEASDSSEDEEDNGDEEETNMDVDEEVRAKVKVALGDAAAHSDAEASLC
jgi:hypothetical protein